MLNCEIASQLADTCARLDQALRERDAAIAQESATRRERDRLAEQVRRLTAERSMLEREVYAIWNRMPSGIRAGLISEMEQAGLNCGPLFEPPRPTRGDERDDG